MSEGDQDQGQEKTELPTPRRLEKAREKGQVPRSRELNTAALTLGAAGFLVFFGQPIAEGLKRIARESFILEPAEVRDPSVLWGRLASALIDGVVLLAPFFVFSLAVAMLSPLLLGGWSFSLEVVRPKLEKISPIKGLQRVFGPRGLMEFLKAFAKFVVLTVGAVLLIMVSTEELVSLGMEPESRALAHAASLLGEALLVLSFGLLLIAAIDVPYQLWQHAHDLRMTHQEVRDESKETEGRPEVRGEIRKRQREMAQGRMMQNVPEADVVITNPTQYAVALRYAEDMRAPRVVAKGTDRVARRIREVASENGVPLFEAAPLARLLHSTTELEQEIPARVYVGVAQILAYVYRVDAARREGRAAPPPPVDLDLPPDESAEGV